MNYQMSTKVVLKYSDGRDFYFDKSLGNIFDKYNNDKLIALELLLVQNDNKYGVFDLINGNYLFEVSYDKIDVYVDEKFCFLKFYSNGYIEIYDVISKKKIFKMECEYAKSTLIKDRYILFGINGQMGLYDIEKSDVVIDCLYKYIHCTDDDWFLICDMNDLWGYVNIFDGRLIVPKYEGAGEFKNGYALISDNYINNMGIIDENGVEIVEPQFPVLGNYNGDFAVGYDKNNFFLIDKRGNKILYPNVDYGLIRYNNEYNSFCLIGYYECYRTDYFYPFDNDIILMKSVFKDGKVNYGVVTYMNNNMSFDGLIHNQDKIKELIKNNI